MKRAIIIGFLVMSLVEVSPSVANAQYSNGIPSMFGLINTVPGSVLGASTFRFGANLKRGSKGSEVSELQKFLLLHGFFVGEPTGFFGPVTQSAVKKYQLTKGIKSTGYCDPTTRAALNADIEHAESDRPQSGNKQEQDRILALIQDEISAIRAHLNVRTGL